MTQANPVDTTEARAPAGRPTRPLASVRYIVCLAILIVAGGSMQMLARVMRVHFAKAPLPLKKPLSELSIARLRPTYDLHPQQPPPFSEDLIENLGTREFLNWNLIDTRRRRLDPTYLASLFVSYYTGQPDMVPHEPRECLVASGMSLEHEETMTVTVPLADRDALEIPVAILDFESAGDAISMNPRKLTVAFFFYANGKFVTTRNGVRLAVANLSDRYAYYSKIEISFSSDGRRRFADREETKTAAAELIRRLMPILLSDHYQDWEAIQAGQPPER
ncbi:MAG: hypothetical protein D6744_11665 [Planctomycetota bacterium]|nr:MAG: hypothetical protein D6744_11665 [Planctomycetota bacterium]